MTHVLVGFNTSDGEQQPSIAKIGTDSNRADTLVIFSEVDVDGLTAGQLSFKHDVARGTEPGTFQV